MTTRTNTERSQHNCVDYRAAAVALWGDAGAHVHDCYQHWLALFPELPEYMPIVIGLRVGPELEILSGDSVGLSRVDDPYLDGPRITIARDVMVHEMLHWLHATGRNIKHQSSRMTGTTR